MTTFLKKISFAFDFSVFNALIISLKIICQILNIQTYTETQNLLLDDIIYSAKWHE